MKKISLLLITIALYQLSFAQNNVGIGTLSPDTSAALDVTSSNKGLLIPRVALKSGIDWTTIPLPATSLLVYNTNSAMTAGTGYYFNNGTPASPNWTKINDLTLPYYKATSATKAAFQIENYSQTSTSAAIKGYSAGGTGVYAASSWGTALQTDGKVTIGGVGQSPHYGKVLTSDSSGNATWEGAVAFSISGIKATNTPIEYGVSKKIFYAIEQYDIQNNLSYASVFKAPVNGIYHFDALATTMANRNTATSPTQHRLFLMCKKGGVTSIAAETIDEITHATDASHHLNVDYPLQAGDEVWVELWQNAKTNAALVQENELNHFSGSLLVKTAP